jgi:hypothetical protein
MAAALEAMHALTPRARPSLYAKRWWTQDLTQLHRIDTHWKNRARAARRTGVARLDLEETAKGASKQYYDAIRQQKRKHWDDFLADNDNIWNTAKYLKAGSKAFRTVLALRRTDGTTTSDYKEQAKELLSTFSTFKRLHRIPLDSCLSACSTLCLLR